MAAALVRRQAAPSRADAGDPTRDGKVRLAATLRLALAMRGGVSLAVWIGGAVAEIDLVRYACLEAPPPGPEPEHRKQRREIYRRLLACRNYQNVEVDILAGASAGGLNAVIYGFAQSVGSTVEWLDDVWRDTGGIWDLLRPTYPRGARFIDRFPRWVPSLLQGDEYFYVKVREALAQHRPARPNPAAVAEHVTIDLSATLLEPEQTGSASSGPGRSAVHFHFDRRPAPQGSPFTDLPGADPAADADLLDLQVARLALAGRSTSSFPGAFEPASIYTTPGQDWVRPEPGSPVFPTMRGLFSEVRNTDSAFQVVDGGIFDNIPIGRALEAITAAPAAGPTERHLLYLDPSPPTPGLPIRQSPRSAAELIPTIARSLFLKQRQETDDQEIPQLRQHNEGVLTANNQRNALAERIAANPAAEWAITVESYARYRMGVDAPRYAVLATRPVEALLRAALPPTPHPALTEREALQISARITAQYQNPALTEELPVDVQAVLDASTLLIAWIRALERQSAVTELGAVKQRLYRILALAQHIRDRADDIFLTELDGKLSHLDVAVAAAHGCQRAWPAAPSAAPNDLGSVLVPENAADEATFWAAANEYFTQTTPQPGNDGLLTQLWEHLTTARETIMAVPPLGPSGAPDWADSLYAQFSSAPMRELPLPQLHAVVAAAGGVPGTASAIAFHDVSGDQDSPLAPQLDEVLDSARRARLTQLLRTANAELTEAAFPPAEGLFTAQAKLAGNTLANFAGFLSARWRAHDWTWGRMDSAAKLVEIILGPEQLTTGRELNSLWTDYVATSPPGFTNGQWAQLLDVPETELPLPLPDQLTQQDDQRLRRAIQAWLQCCILAERQDATAAPTRSVEALVAPLNRDKAGLRELPRSYLFGIASRVAQLSHRALWPRTLNGSTFVLGVLTMLLRPLWITLPLLAAPLRLATTAAVLAWLSPLSWDGTYRTGQAGPGLATAATIVLTIAAVVTLIRLHKAGRRWRAIRSAVTDLPDPAWTAIVGQSWARRRWWIWGGTVLALLAIVLAWLSWVSVLGRAVSPDRATPDWATPDWAGATLTSYPLFGSGVQTAVLVIAVLAVLWAVVQRARSAPAAEVPAARRWSRLPWVAVGLAGAVATIPAWSAWTLDHAVQQHGPLTPAGYTVAAAIVLALLLHQGWASRPGLMVAGVLIGASAWLSAEWAVPWFSPLGVVLLTASVGTALTSLFLQIRDSAV